MAWLEKLTFGDHGWTSVRALVRGVLVHGTALMGELTFCDRLCSKSRWTRFDNAPLGDLDSPLQSRPFDHQLRIFPEGGTR